MPDLTQSAHEKDAGTSRLGEERLRALLEVGRSLVSDLDLESVLCRVLETAREMTGARYAALGILDRDKSELERFLYLGVDEETARSIGALPRGHGVLGELIRDPAPLRLGDVSAHPRSYGFPAGHPAMTTFLGAPVIVRDEVFGNIYLTEKAGGAEFDPVDEELIVVLAEWAAVAIGNARLYESTDRQRSELERAVRGLQANVALTRETGGHTELDWLLELVAKRALSLVEAGSAVVLLPAEHELEVAGVAGELPEDLLGTRIDPDGGRLGSAFRSGNVARVKAGVGGELGLPEGPALIAPLFSRGRVVGVLGVLGAQRAGGFSPEDELLLESFAGSAASAIGTAQVAEQEKLRLSIAASENERRRWARELHDDTLQQLGALKLMNESALRRDDPETTRKTLTRAVAQLEQSIASLEELITELRPAALDDLGIAAALDVLLDRMLPPGTRPVCERELDLAYDAGRATTRLAPELEVTIYRIVQEALNNVRKHAGADGVRVTVLEDPEHVTVTVTDDGGGFEPGAGAMRFGLTGMRERVRLADGELTITSTPGEGTRVFARLPVVRAG
ncbi:MAG TPA: GAF domain-containing protein [Solirubrobacterales bacterium]|nr:GAF domain-containing protein [Solirubrobacterales bacterium]